MLKKNLTKVIATVGAMAAGVAAGTAAVHADSIYTVQSGDTLSGISMKFTNDISKVNELARMNNIQDINTIYVGQKLLIKSNGQIQQATAQQVATLPAAINASQSSNASQSNNNGSTHSSSSNQSSSNLSSSEAAAKAWIAQHESGGNYNAQNGQYVGKYQLSASYLNGDYSPANQDRVADQYVAQRYGSWVNAQAHWEANGWY